MSGRRAVIVAAKRSPIGRIGGCHRRLSIGELAAPVLRALVEETSIPAGRIDEIVMGNAAGGGGNPARLAALYASLPAEVPAVTIDRQCTSGLDAIVYAARLIEAGSADIVIAGGAESASTAPWRIARPRDPYRELPRFFAEAEFAPAGAHNPTMMEGAEAVARAMGLSRAEQDAYALQSMERAAAAAQSHALDKLMVPLSGASEDETLHMSNAKILARAPSIIPGGTVSAGNAAANGDAAAFVIVVSDAVFREFGFEHGLLVGASAAVGCDPGLPGLGSAAAINKLLAKTGGAAAEFSRIELIEAFASQALATVRCVSLDMAKVNPWGGALAFGHPFGASGAILVCHLFAAIMSGDSAATGNRPARFLASGASAGGLGVAVEFAVC